MTEQVGVIRLNVRAMLGRSYPRVVGGMRELSWIFFETVLPLLSVAAYVFVYKAFLPQNATQSQIDMVNSLIGYVVIGGTMTAFWLNVLWSMASQLYWEKEVGNLQL